MESAEHTAVLWLADLPDMFRVRNTATKNAMIDDKHQERLYPNKIAFGVNTVKQELLESRLNLANTKAVEDMCSVYALIHIAADEMHHELKHLTRHQRMRRDFFARLSHGKSNVGFQSYFHVLNVIALPQPIQMPKLRQDRCFFTSMPVTFVEDVFDDLTAQDDHDVPDWVFRMSRWCLRTAKPFAALIAKGIMKSISVCDLGVKRENLLGCHSFVVGWPEGGGRQKRCQADEEELPELTVYEHELANLQSQFKPPTYTSPSVESLATCSSTLSTEFLIQTVESVQNLVRYADVSGVQVPHDVLQTLHDNVSGLQAHADRITEFEKTRLVMEAFNQKYSVVTLIHSFVACGYLKNDGRFRDACRWMLCACLPKDIAEHMVGLLISDKQQLRLPSPATLSRLRGRMDTAWMLTFQLILQDMMLDGGVVIYPMIDSSPQAGRDYEMVVLNVVASKLLAELHYDIVKLEQRNISFYQLLVVVVVCFSSVCVYVCV